MWEFSLGMGNMNPLPIAELFSFFEQLVPTTPEGNKLDGTLIELGQVTVCRQLGIEDKGWLTPRRTFCQKERNAST